MRKLLNALAIVGTAVLVFTGCAGEAREPAESNNQERYCIVMPVGKVPVYNCYYQ